MCRYDDPKRTSLTFTAFHRTDALHMDTFSDVSIRTLSSALCRLRLASVPSNLVVQNTIIDTLIFSFYVLYESISSNRNLAMLQH